MDVLIAHPYKHHILHIAAAFFEYGFDAEIALPFYAKGLGRAMELFPGAIGKKASGYFHKSIPRDCVISPPIMQIKKLCSFASDVTSIEPIFDNYVAEKIKKKKWRPKVVLVLQGYMPKTVLAAKDAGIIVWIDLINFTFFAKDRLELHYRSMGFSPPAFKMGDSPSCAINADFITFPSSVHYQSIKEYLGRDFENAIVPYGVEFSRFSSNKHNRSYGDSDVITVVARANSISKGGHLLLHAMSEYGDKIVELLNGRCLKVLVLGKFDAYANIIANRLSFNKKISITSRNYSHLEVPHLLDSADIFAMPTLSESMSMACVEAMASGIPVIATQYAAVDSFQGGTMGAIVDDNVDSFASAFLSLLKNRQDWPSMGEACKTSAEHLCWSGYKKSMAASLNKLMGD